MGTKCHVHFHLYDCICCKYPVLILILAGDLSVVSPSASWDIGTTRYLFEQPYSMLPFWKKIEAVIFLIIIIMYFYEVSYIIF